MLPSRGECHIAHNFERDLLEVQNYIQARLQPEEPNLLCVNAALVDEYRDELDNYVKQKHRQHQVRRTLPSTPSPTNRSELPPANHAVQVQEKRPRVRSREGSRVAQPPMPKRLPSVKWLLAHHHACAASIPTTPAVHRYAPTPVIPTHSFHAYPVHHRILKKQKTM